jgi:WD40 repeat protein
MPRIALLALICLALVAPALGAAPLWTHTASQPVRDCAVSSDGKVVVVSNELVHIFDRKGTLVDTVWPANDVALPPKASLIAAATDDGLRAVLKNGTDLWAAGPNRSVAVAVSSDGKTVAGLTPGGFLSVYGSNGKRAGAADTGAVGEVVDLAASENGSVIVSIDMGGVRAFTRKAADRWSVELAAPSALAMNGSGDLVAVGDGGSVKFYGLEGEPAGRYATGGRVRSLAMTPSGNMTVAGAEDGTVTALGPGGSLLWSLQAGAVVRSVAVSGSGDLVATASDDRRLRLVGGNGTVLWEAGLAGEPRALALSADGSTVVVGCNEGTAYLFETAVKPAATAKAANATGTTTPAATGTANETMTGADNSTDEISFTISPDAGANGTATATPQLQDAVVTGTPKSGAPPILLAVALGLLGTWAGLRRRR